MGNGVGGHEVTSEGVSVGDTEGFVGDELSVGTFDGVILGVSVGECDDS